MSEMPRPSGRVVVTGIGAVTPLATGMEATWSRLVAGDCAIDRIAALDPSEFSTQIAAEVRDFNPEDYLDKKEARRIDRFISLAVAGATMALEDSGLKIDDDNREHIGAWIGSGIGGLTTMGEQYRRLIASGPGKVSPFLVPYMIPDMASGYVSIVHQIKGPNACVVSACATGANSIGDAYHIVKRGDAVAMLAGGSEAPINEIGIAGFCAARAMSQRNDDPKHASRPFDADRDGFVIAEGSAILLVEDYDHAKARGAKIYGEIVGYGMSADAYHVTQPDPEASGAYRSMGNALRSAGMAGTRNRLHQRARNVDALQRQAGDRGDQAASRGWRIQGPDQQHQVDDRPSARRGRGDRSGYLPARDARRRGSADDQL